MLILSPADIAKAEEEIQHSSGNSKGRPCGKVTTITGGDLEVVLKMWRTQPGLSSKLRNLCGGRNWRNQYDW